MIGVCAAPNPDAGIVRGLLDTVDCNIREGVQGGYEALFGPTSPLTAVITVLLTLYVAGLGFRLLTGRTDMKVGDLPMIALKIGAVIMLTTSWASYQSLVFSLLFDGPAELANTLLAAMPPPPGQEGTDIFARLQFTFDQLTQSAAALAKTDDVGSVNEAANAARAAIAAQASATTGALPQDFAPIIQMRSALQGGPAFGATALWLSAVTLLVSTLGLLLLSKLMLGLLLAIGPLFVGMLLFETTKGFFEGWLRTALGFALVPLATVVFTAGLLASIDPSLGELAKARFANTYNLQPVMTVLVLVLTFTIVFASVMGLCTRLVAGFRLPSPPPRADEPSFASMAAGPSAAAALAAEGPPPSRAARLAASLGGATETGDRRDIRIAASMGSGGAGSMDRRTELAAGGDIYRRDPVERLGQASRRRVAPARARTGTGLSGQRPGGLA
jgi:type IV secretion system protein VirB6